MKKIILFLATQIIIIFLLSACSSFRIDNPDSDEVDSLDQPTVGCHQMNKTNPEADEFDVQIIGDSVFDLNGYIHTYLKEFSGKSYRDNSVSGHKIDTIRNQYRSAIENNPEIRTIIMDGGANDILMHPFWNMACRSDDEPSKTCKKFIEKVVDELAELWEEIHSDGVENIIYSGYYHLKPGYFSFNGKRLNGAIDYAVETIIEKCSESVANCHFVDSRPYFSGNESTYIKNDGLHPTPDGGKVLAEIIWETMVEKDVYR